MTLSPHEHDHHYFLELSETIGSIGRNKTSIVAYSQDYTKLVQWAKNHPLYKNLQWVQFAIRFYSSWEKVPQTHFFIDGKNWDVLGKDGRILELQDIPEQEDAYSSVSFEEDMEYAIVDDLLHIANVTDEMIKAHPFWDDPSYAPLGNPKHYEIKQNV